MKLTDSKIWLWGLFLSCPLGEEVSDCPIKSIRNKSVKGKFDFIENLPHEEIDKLLQIHSRCLQRREN
ncbi:hypothetical protein [Maribellus maritimus]|uniref:hypothetical protein n=1 Tax=Maribellus maritimus TaxID=2870838 RepID=UPI001EECB8B2|nr:hypothetical protein [Maribellus maritimus]MCG6189248.1 hypothetical protein [Maribellus maritimus]